jgi:hypothetical protein
MDVTFYENSEHIITYEDQNEFLRIVRSNFNYNSKELKCDFKYENIETQICERYLQTKQVINMKVFITIQFIN